MLRKRTGLIFILILLMPLIPYFICSGAKNEVITLINAETGISENIALTDYILGALAGSVPTGYEKEALKAQAVIIYSYTLSAENIYVQNENGIIYIDETEQRQLWGDEYEKNREYLENIINSVLHLHLTGVTEFGTDERISQLAINGYDYREILKYIYPDGEIEKTTA